MALSAKKIRQIKYTPFPNHTNRAYHSPNLPNPNVIRIEVLSPEARQRYLNDGIYAIRDTFQKALSAQLLAGDGTKPFYGFFDPSSAGVDFDISAHWENGKHGFNEITSVVKSIPIVGHIGGSVMEKASKFGGMLTKAAGIDTKSTGACTLKDFNGASFDFVKTVKCRWYMPAQEYVARLSIARLLKMAYVRPMNMDTKDFTQKLTEAANEVFATDAWKTTSQTLTEIGQTVNDAMEDLPLVGDVYKGVVEGAKYLDEKITGDEAKKTAGDVIKELVNSGLEAWMKLNEYFGGNLTINPFPVRLTMGHILDIEPLVIKTVKFHGSQEQFISEDGTHIPLFIEAEIGFDMWMIPDPSKGFVRWLGDDIFNGKITNVNPKSGGTSKSGGGKKKKGGKKTGGKKK
jgi:hypothetical protein